MDAYTLWSLRLGFSSKQAERIKKHGIERFVKDSFAPSVAAIPHFIDEMPKTLDEIKQAYRHNGDDTKRRMDRTKRMEANLELKAWWIDRMRNEELPLREKMALFWHNHYVAAFSKVSVNYWIYCHNGILRENAFGNFRELTKKIVRSNAMLRYLDNNKNVKGKNNENLSRELLELFTIGIGNYTEEDIRNGAKGLSGLSMGDDGGAYRKGKSDREEFTYFGKKGNFKADEMVDIIFGQKNAPYHITRKILKWFVYDTPPEERVIYYGDYLREVDYEIAPLMLKMITEEFDKQVSGTKIKDPLLFILQLLHELDIKEINSKMVAHFIRFQGMDLFDQPNVKGWLGGAYWLSSQIYQQRQNLSDMLCTNAKNSRLIKIFEQDSGNALGSISTKLSWKKNGNNKDIIADLSERLLFYVDDDMQANFETVLKYDFNPGSVGAENGVMRLFNSMVRTPEFQII